MKTILWSVAVVIVLVALMTLIPQPASAAQVTLTGPDEEVQGDTKVCIYSGHGIERVTTVRNEQNCPYAKTFDTDSDE